MILKLFPTLQLTALQTYKEYSFIVVSGKLLFTGLSTQTSKLNKEMNQRLEVEECLRQETAHVDSFVQTISQMNARLDLGVVLQFICKETSATMRVEGVTLALYYPEHGTLELEAMHGMPHGFRQGFEPLLFSSGAVKLLTQSDPIVVLGTSEDSADLPHADLYRKTNYCSLAYVPLRHNQDLFGVLIAVSLSEKTAQFTPYQLDLLEAFADSASLVVRSSRLYSDVLRSSKKLDALRTGDLAILSSLDLNLTLKVFLQQLTNELQADAADILLLDSGTHLLGYSAGIGFATGCIKETQFSLGEGHAGKVALERRNINIDDLRREKIFLRQKLIEGEGFVTYFGAPLIAKGQIKGVLEIFHRSSFHPTDQWLSFAETLAGQLSIAIDNASLYSSLQQTNADLMIAYDRTLEGWSHALDLRDRETEGHTERVTELCLQLAEELNIHEDKLIQIRRGALLHDIGKMGIPDQNQLKNSDLSAEAKKIMEQHPTYALTCSHPFPT